MCWFYMGIAQIALDPPSVERANLGKKCPKPSWQAFIPPTLRAMPIENRHISTTGFPKLDLLLYRKFFICLDSLSGGAQVFCQRMHFFFLEVCNSWKFCSWWIGWVSSAVFAQKKGSFLNASKCRHIWSTSCARKSIDLPLKFETIATWEEWLLKACSECWQWQN